jgi:tetratricopeptide (TPR) repeat protein
LGTIFLSTLSLLFINYSVYLWENKKIQDLTNKIKPSHKSENENILEKNQASRGFTSIDMGESMSKQRSISPINADERKVLFVDEDLQPKWLTQIITFFKRLRANFWIQLKNAFVYLINLAKNTETKSENKEEERLITEVIQKVKDIDEENDARDNSAKDSVSPSNQVVVINPKKNEEESELTQAEKNNELFEKMEDKLLKKLKEVGMNHFDIWLDLGKLYEDQKEPKKAKEIYQMVLKHATGKEQEIARNALYRNS